MPVHQLDVQAAEAAEREPRQRPHGLRAVLARREREAHRAGRPALEGAAEDAHAEAADDQPGERPDGHAVALELHDDRLGPLRAGHELEPLGRLEDVAPPLRFDRGVDSIQRNSLQAKHRSSLTLDHQVLHARRGDVAGQANGPVGAGQVDHTADRVVALAAAQLPAVDDLVEAGLARGAAHSRCLNQWIAGRVVLPTSAGRFSVAQAMMRRCSGGGYQGKSGKPAISTWNGLMRARGREEEGARAPQDAEDLAQDLVGIVDVLEHRVGVDEVDRLVLEGQRLGHARPDVELRRPSPRRGRG